MYIPKIAKIYWIETHCDDWSAEKKMGPGEAFFLNTFVYTNFERKKSFEKHQLALWICLYSFLFDLFANLKVKQTTIAVLYSVILKTKISHLPIVIHLGLIVEFTLNAIC